MTRDGILLKIYELRPDIARLGLYPIVLGKDPRF